LLIENLRKKYAQPKTIYYYNAVFSFSGMPNI
jgi:hypothetical protein